MLTARKSFVFFAMLGMLMFVAAPAVADWAPADGHKMHFPQLPDTDGWDVNATAPMNMLADDWTCSETGPVKDIHFWGSWRNGIVGVITNFNLSIYSNILAPPGGGYSMPGGQLWENSPRPLEPPPIDPSALEGWYDPVAQSYHEKDHGNYFQYNVFLPQSEWFHQIEGQVYWLGISANVVAGTGTWGWKTADVSQYPDPFTGNHYMDDAVYRSPANGGWLELRDPLLAGHPSLDLAFVITPEPSTVAMLLCGGLATLLAYAWRRRKRT